MSVKHADVSDILDEGGSGGGGMGRKEEDDHDGSDDDVPLVSIVIWD